jgi:hypothetical protein
MILLSLTEAGILQPDEYTKAVAKMIGMGFTTVFFDAKCVLESAKLAEYRTSSPLKQMLEVFQNATSTPPVLVRQFLEFFVMLQGGADSASAKGFNRPRLSRCSLAQCCNSCDGAVTSVNECAAVRTECDR